MRKHVSRFAAIAAVAMLAAALTPAIAVGKSPQAAAQYTAGRYLVTFADAPVAEYSGYVKGFTASRAAAGKKLNARSAAAQKWQKHLTSTHDAALAKVGATKIYDYTTTNNGVATRLSASQAQKLSQQSGVVRLEKDQRAQVDTTESPHFLGLDAPGGIWSQLPGGGPKAGAGLVIGVIDTGIWPENPSFKGGTGIPIPPDWHGVCKAGQNWGTSTCNDKIIGARYYYAGFGRKNIDKSDFKSPRDGAGHGSHTSSTAAGNYGVKMSIDGNLIGTGSGMAPGAKIAMYKVCWTGEAPIPDGCFNSDSVAAINDAVADGVDVINYSIGGTSESDVFDSVEQAFRGASNAGVFVANSAGNSGPGASTLDHPSPWLTTVAAATFRRAFQAVELGNGARYVGASTTLPLPDFKPIATAGSVKLAAAAAADANRCFAGTLDPAKTAGKIVVCDRGVNARIDKSFEVKRAGGVGMVLANVSPNSLNGDYHAVPSTHITDVDGAAVKAYSATLGATAKIVPLTAAELAAAPKVPEVTDFSSRGPSTTTGGDILKPDIAAPGNDVIAAVAPPSNHGRTWDFMSGTSMSSPHIAGIALLLKAAHKDWLPSEIKSAMMTSARDTVSSASDPFAQGAGFIKPNGAVDPGLVYSTTATEYRQYLVSLGVHFAPPNDTLTPITASNLNQASIAIGSLPGSQTVTRHVKNVGSATATYNASASVPGFTVAVTPASLTLAPGATGNFTVAFSRTDAAFGQWAIGKLTWTDGSHIVRSPITLRPVPVAAPVEVHGDASAAGSKTFDVTPGFTGPLSTTVSGLVGVTPTADSVAIGAFDITAPVVDADTDVYHVIVPAGTRAARFSLDADSTSDDLDLFVYKAGVLVDLSASGSGDEQVTLINPVAATYDVYVNGFAGVGAYHISNFVVPVASAGNGTVTPNPAPVTQGTPSTLSANWTGLDPAKRWFGVINYVTTNVFTYFSVG